jgi:hypothetical protein
MGDQRRCDRLQRRHLGRPDRAQIAQQAPPMIVRSSGLTTWRYAILGSASFTDVRLTMAVPFRYSGTTGTTSLIARWVDSSNHLRFDLATVSAGVWFLPEPIALYSGRNMQVRYDDTLRQDSTGTYTGGRSPTAAAGSSAGRHEPRAREGAPQRHRGRADDNVTDATQIQVGWTPRGLAVPR